jgi:ribosomal protein S18 acetylase RimI-like enzyme
MLELHSTLEVGLHQTVALLNQGFSDYFVPIVLDLASLLHMAGQESIDLECSQVALRDGKAVGVALIARRGWTSRLAAMSVIPSARGARVGSELVAHLIARARARQERAMVLEVIEGNGPAIRLYQGAGFEIVRRLVGYDAAPTGASEPEASLNEIDLRELARLVSAYGLPDLSWQISGESVAHLGPPNVAYAWEGAYVGLSDPEEELISVRSLLVRPEARGQGRAGRLLRATMARYPHKAWRVPPLCPEELGGLFERAGFEQSSLSQLQMRVALG